MARWRARCRQVLQPGPQLRQWASTHLIYVMHTQSRGERGGGIGTRNLRLCPLPRARPGLGAPAPLPNPARCFDCRIDPPTPARTVIWLLAAIIVGGRLEPRGALPDLFGSFRKSGISRAGRSKRTHTPPVRYSVYLYRIRAARRAWRAMAALTNLEDDRRAPPEPLASLKQQVPPHYLLVFSGGLCTLVTLWITGLTGFPPGFGAPSRRNYNTQAESAACQIVAAEYRAVDEVARLVRLVAQPAQCSVRVYSKSGSCRQIDTSEWAAAASVSVSCTMLRNTGREQHTFAHHVVQHWDALPARLHFVALPLQGVHHDRLSPLKRGLLDPKHTCQTFVDAKRRRAATFAERVSHFCGRASCPEARAQSSTG